MKATTKVKFSGVEIKAILMNKLRKKYKDVKLSHIQIKDKREHEWENKFEVDYMEFEVK